MKSTIIASKAFSRYLAPLSLASPSHRRVAGLRVSRAARCSQVLEKALGLYGEAEEVSKQERRERPSH